MDEPDWLAVQVYLRKRNATEETVATEVQRFKEERRRNMKQEDGEVQEVISRVRASRPPSRSRDDEVGDDDEDVRGADDDADDDNDMISVVSPVRGRGRGSRGRGESSRRGGRGRGGRGRAASLVAEEPAASASRGSKNTRSIKDAFLMASSSSRSRKKAHPVYV